MSLPDSGTILVKKVNENDDWIEEYLDASDIPINTPGSPWSEAGVSSTILESAIAEIATSLNTKAAVVSSGSAFNFTGTTTDDAEIALDALKITDGVCLKFTYDVSAWNSTDNKFYGTVIDGVVYRDGGGAVLVDGNISRLEFGESNGYLARAITSGNDLQFTVSGSAGETVNWRGKVNFTSDNIVEEALVFEGTRQNNTTPITFRNSTNTSDISVLNLTDSDILLLENPGDITIQSNQVAGVSGSESFMDASTGNLELEAANALALRSLGNDIIIAAEDDIDIKHVAYTTGGVGSRIYLDRENSDIDLRSGYGEGDGCPIFMDSNGGISLLTAQRSIVFGPGDSNKWEMFSNGNLLPSTNNAYTVGSNTNRMSAVYSNSYLPFTGQHVYKLSASGTPSVGDAVCLNASYELEACSSPQDIGFLSKDDIIVTDLAMLDSMGVEHAASGTVLRAVADCGDAVTGTLNRMKVCNEGGNISIGDLLCSSSVSGYLMRQSVDSVKNFTVAKALQNVTFSSSTTVSGVYGYLLL